eukprot:CAMPEP_0172481882 /NCGR_PEP_ID=MMETSP1066-20121228/8046_1 /TAXON_ID=671091 /ORGANISM="Coscinodiscus wailesii, Strain CCMP2513" /LENGTH=136 /DNA_ID=CAMNT_0013244571 /DNA_START=24 /DNA_END=431 /DNA_ORIENTATION=-
MQPSKLTIGCRVSAKIGPLMSTATEDPTNKSRRLCSVLHGTIVSSQPDLLWRVHWDEIDRTSDHSSKNLRLLSAMTVTDTDKILLQEWARKRSIYVGKHQDMMQYTRDISQNETTLTLLDFADMLCYNMLHNSLPK